MSLYLEHGTFQKARRALIVSSITSIVLQNITLKTDSMNLFGLIVSVDEMNFILFSKITVLYFLIVYATLLRQSIINFKPFSFPQSEVERIGAIVKSSSNKPYIDNETGRTEFIPEWALKAFDKKPDSDFLDRVYFYIVLIGLSLFLAATALIEIPVLSWFREFL